MNAGATTERVLAALRIVLVSRDLTPGLRLDPALLAKRLDAGLTPMREALHLLTGEGLVESRTGGGFSLPFLDAGALADRYAWSGQLLAIALHNWPRHRQKGANMAPTILSGTIAERCGMLFLHIASLSANGEHVRAMRRLNGRLHHARLVEEDVLTGLDEEIEDLHRRIDQGDRRHLLASCAHYHQRRMKFVKDIIQAMYRNI